MTDAGSRIARQLARELRIGIPLMVAIAALLTVLFREPFLTTFIYTACVSVLIQGLIEGGRFGMVRWLRGRVPDSMFAHHNWPGWPLMAPWVLFCGLIGYAGGQILGDLFTGRHRLSGAILGNPRALLIDGLLVFGVPMACVFYFYARGRMAALEARTQAVLRMAAEVQLKLLESQLEPHMLFNTLANLRVLISQDPDRAQAMLDRLIAFLRVTLDAARAETHPLDCEFARLADYLALMQVRMGTRLQSRFDLPADLAGLEVPPLLLQPLVENALKHGLEPKIDGGRVDVSAWREGGTLLLSVRDTGAGLALQAPAVGGFGLQQVRQRLATLYGAAASFVLAPELDGEGGTVATIRIPLAATAPRESHSRRAHSQRALP